MNYPQPLKIDELVAFAHVTARSKGFYPEGEKVSIPERLALIHSEVSEALEIARAGADLTHGWYSDNGKPEGFLVELADVVIRVFDLVGYVSGVELDEQGDAHLKTSFMEIIRDKMLFNLTRPPKHGKQF